MYTESLLVNALYYLTAAVIAVPLFKAIGLGSILGYLFAGVVLDPVHWAWSTTLKRCCTLLNTG